ncbi:MAG: methyl-accepting chemotaxis protein [Burkholderiales bacterium]
MRFSGLQFKVLALVAGAMFVSLGIAVYSLYRVYDTTRDLDRISRLDSQTQQGILRATVAFKIQVQEWKNVLLRGKDALALDRHWKAFAERESEVRDLVRKARASATDGQIREALERFERSHAELGERYRAGLKTFRESGADPVAGDRSVAGIDRAPTAALVDAEALAARGGEGRIAGTVKDAAEAFTLALVFTIAVMLAAIVVTGIFLRRLVLAPIGAAAGFSERIAEGDLTVAIHARSGDEIGQLLGAMDRMKGSLADVVGKVRVAAESVVTASSQVAAGTTDLSQRTEEQASSLEETAASMEELSSTVKQNADNARTADELSRGASQRAEQGGAEVVRMVVTMSEISSSAARIAEIISVIDAIAFQTNILALNAAVEAARAGEQGRGFAVVAAEVRSLAHRSAQAAKEIKDLIADSLQKVDTGMHQVEQAGDTIQALVIDVKQVSDLMRSIAEASAEQSRGVQQVNKTVTEMDKVVQQNASAVQQSASAAEGMRLQAEALLRAVSAFRVSTGGVPGASLPAAAGPRPLAITGRRERGDAPGDQWEEF